MNRKLVILGGGESGAGAAVLGRLKGYDVFVSDAGPIRDSYKKELEEYDVPYEEEKHTEERILEADEVMKSPGIPHNNEMVQKIVAKGIPLVKKI